MPSVTLNGKNVNQIDENKRYGEKESANWVRSGLNQTVSDIETKTWTQIRSSKLFHCAMQCSVMAC